MILAITFHRELNRQTPSGRITQARRMLYTIYAVLFLISVSLGLCPHLVQLIYRIKFKLLTKRNSKTRIIFRLVEYSSGFTSTIPNHEAFMYCLDSLPMLTALVLLNISHPGAVMPGKESDSMPLESIYLEA